MDFKNKNIGVIAAIIAVVAITAGLIGFLFVKKVEAPTAVSSTAGQASQAVPQVQSEASRIPTGWKTYSGDLSGLSKRFTGKKISFSYPAEWGAVTVEQSSEGTASDGPGERVYDLLKVTFSSYPNDYDGLGATIKITDAKSYATPQDVTFLKRIAMSNIPVGDNDLVALNKLGHGYGSTVFFGVNLAKKFVPQNVQTSDGAGKGISFFMDDTQGFGPGLSYNVTLLDQSADALIGGNFPVTSSQQDVLAKELDSIDLSVEGAGDTWYGKKEALVNGSYESDPDYMAIVKNVDRVMQSVSIR
ncbi:MAG: hypothetical protein WCJ25_03540 [Candidatus Moraniibacteriota bacterium]